MKHLFFPFFLSLFLLSCKKNKMYEVTLDGDYVEIASSRGWVVEASDSMLPKPVVSVEASNGESVTVEFDKNGEFTRIYVMDMTDADERITLRYRVGDGSPDFEMRKMETVLIEKINPSEGKMNPHANQSH